MSTNRREFVMLARTVASDSTDYSGWYASEKLDGQRCIWDGGISFGARKIDIPWANRGNEATHDDICTGLWSRYGNVIHAPRDFVFKMINTYGSLIMDGELYLGRGQFQEMRSIVSRHSPDSRWSEVEYRPFDVISPHIFFQDGRISGSHVIRYSDCIPFVKDCSSGRVDRFSDVVGRYSSILHPQTVIKDNDHMYEMLDSIVSNGGEGLIIRNPRSVWSPARVGNMLKLKNFLEGTCKIVGFYFGEGKYTGMMGSLYVSDTISGKLFCLSGFTDGERELLDHEYAANNPRELAVSTVLMKHFQIGMVIRYKYRELTDGGVPKEARYWR
jgi:DNA ligase-1